MYSLLVFEGGLHPSYVLDEMEFYEIPVLLESLYMRYRHGWDQTRELGRMFLQPYSKKSIKSTDVLKFPWDKVDIVDTSDNDRLRQKLNDYENYLNGKSGLSNKTFD